MAEEVPEYVWIDVGHVGAGLLPDKGVVAQHGKVAVDVNSGVPVDPQPDYPEGPEDPDAPAPEPTKAPAAAKSSS